MPVVDTRGGAAQAATRNGRIGVIGTRATITTRLGRVRCGPRHRNHRGGLPSLRGLRRARRHHARQVPGWGWPDPLQRAEVDTLVLGCNVHPLLSGLI